MTSRRRLPAPIRGALWMLAAAICYVGAATMARHVKADYSVFELTFIRAVVAILFMAPMFARIGGRALHTRRIGLHLLNGLMAYLAILCWFFAAMRMPVAEFFALQFTSPLITIALATIILGQRVDGRSWIATAIGFTGVLIVLRPGIITVSLGALATLAATTGYASVNTAIKVLSRTEPSTVIVFYANLLMVPLALPMAVIEWRTPGPADLALIIGIAVASTVAFIATARAISAADARIVQPVNFLRLPIGAFLGFVLFNEVPDIWTWSGALIIFASTYYILMRESARTGLR